MSILEITLIIAMAGFLLSLIMLRFDETPRDGVGFLLVGAFLLAAAVAAVASVCFPNTSFAQVTGAIMGGSMLLTATFMLGLFLANR